MAGRVFAGYLNLILRVWDTPCTSCLFLLCLSLSFRRYLHWTIKANWTVVYLFSWRKIIIPIIYVERKDHILVLQEEKIQLIDCLTHRHTFYIGERMNTSGWSKVEHPRLRITLHTRSIRTILEQEKPRPCSRRVSFSLEEWNITIWLDWHWQEATEMRLGICSIDPQSWNNRRTPRDATHVSKKANGQFLVQRNEKNQVKFS